MGVSSPMVSQLLLFHGTYESNASSINKSVSSATSFCPMGSQAAMNSESATQNQPTEFTPIVMNESPVAGPQQDRRMSDEWDASKVPPSRFRSARARFMPRLAHAMGTLTGTTPRNSMQSG